MKKIEFKNVSFKIESAKTNEDTGVLNVKGYASVFGNVDSCGDIVEKGAFKKTISNGIERIKLCYMHSMRDVIGGINELKEDENGLFIDADVLPTTLGRDVAILMKAGVVNEFSIGYYTLDSVDEIKEGKYTRHLKDIDLIEVSVVARAANDKAVVTGLMKKSEELTASLPELSDEELAQLKSEVANEEATRIFNHLKL